VRQPPDTSFASLRKIIIEKSHAHIGGPINESQRRRMPLEVAPSSSRVEKRLGLPLRELQKITMKVGVDVHVDVEAF